MNFTSATKVMDALTATDTVERDRAENRDKIARGINGFPPLSQEKARQMGLKVNVSWLEETLLAKQAMLQYHNAFQSQNNFFNVHIPSAPPEKMTEWGQNLTAFINKPLKASREFAAHLDNVFASLVAHGIAPSLWLKTNRWLPEFVGLNDFRVPTDTETSLKNLAWFAIRRRYTVGQLVDLVFGKYADKGWDKEGTIKILAAYWTKNWETLDYDWSNDPERMTQLVKQNLGFYNSDAVPVVTLWHFYHQNDDEIRPDEWMMKVVPDKVTRGVESADSLKFLFQSDKPASARLDGLLHLHFGDLNGTPPYLYHSVRSLGFLLHESCFWMNLFRCRAFQTAWESFNLLWRSADGSPKARAQFLELFHKGWVPNEVTFIGQNDRCQPNQELVEFVMAQAKQLMGEASASYTQKVDTGTQKEQTLGEASIKLQQANAMMTGLLAVAARNMVFFYREIARRFCVRGSLDPDVRAFREKCKQAGIRVEFLNHDLWDITCDMPLGAGNATLELAQASQLMGVRQMHGPDAQNEILHIFDAAVTKNPRLAQKLVPLGKTQAVSNGQEWATAAFGALMLGVPAPMRSDVNPIDQIKTLLFMSAQVVQRIMQTDNMGTPQDVMGLGNVLKYTQQLITQLAEDKAQASVARNFELALTKLANVVRAFTQRQKQAGKQLSRQAHENISIQFKDLPPDTQNAVIMALGLPPSRMPGIDGKTVKMQQQLAVKDRHDRMKMLENHQEFEREQRREDLRAGHEIQTERAKQRIKLTAAAAESLLRQHNMDKEAARNSARDQGYDFE